MGTSHEADRTLFVGNLDSNVTEELLFELFLQAGPLTNVKIPKDKDGKPKMFAFVNFKHEASVPYGMELLNGTQLFGRPIKVQFRSGSSHGSQDSNSPGHSQNSSPSNTPGPQGGRFDRGMDVGYQSYTPSQLLQRSFSSPDSLQRQAMLYSMWQQQQQGNGAVSPLIQPGYQASGQQHRQGSSGGSWQDLSAHRVHRQHSHQYQQDNEHCSRGSGSDRHVRGQHDDRMNHHNRSHSRDSRREDSRDGRWRQNRY